MENDRKQLILDYQAVFNTGAGKRVLDDIRRDTHYDSDIFVAGQPDLTVFRLGMRRIYLDIRKAIDADPNAEVQEVAEMEATNA